jgi:hypothetical protein
MAFVHPMERGQFAGAAAVIVVACELGIMFSGAVLPTPLYPLYQGRFGFSNVTLTAVYAVYVLGNLAALLIFGRLSDQIGRRSATLPAIGCGILSTICFLFAQGTAWLFAARHLRDLSLAPRLGVPPQIRVAFVSPAVTGFVVFSLIGFYAALIPGLLAHSLHETSPAISGGVVCGLFAVAAIGVMLTARLRSRAAMLGGSCVMLPSVWLLVAAELVRSMTLLLCATAVGGLSAALGYRGSLEEANRIAPGARRSEVVSSYLIAVYAGNSVPVIGIGLLAAIASATIAHVSFAVIITLLAVVALIVGSKARR